MEKRYFRFGNCLSAKADRRLNNETIKELWNGFCFQSTALEFREGEEFHFKTGNIEYPSLSEGKEYAIRVTEQGMAVSAKNYNGLARAMMVLMMRIEVLDLTKGCEKFQVEACRLESSYLIQKRMIHLCIFPETTPFFLKKCIRLAAVMQYTHVVLEFWGMLKYDCIKELAWENACSKESVRELVSEMAALGMEAVPMLNHLGHASGCRVCGGKHVVLDQNPRLALLFTPDGWSWNIENKDVFHLLKQVRRELYEIFDGTKYIHLGCDEVYSYKKGEKSQSLMRGYLHDLTEEVRREGRQPIIWGDMLLNEKACGVEKPYFCGCETEEDAEKLLSSLAPGTVIADWHYEVKQAPVKTSIYLKEHGLEVLGAPWYDMKNCEAHVKTICEQGLSGLLVTTWHTLAQRMPHIVAAAVLCGAYHSPWSREDSRSIQTETAALIRKASFSRGNYLESGWTEKQIFLLSNPVT